MDQIHYVISKTQLIICITFRNKHPHLINVSSFLLKKLKMMLYHYKVKNLMGTMKSQKSSKTNHLIHIIPIVLYICNLMLSSGVYRSGLIFAEIKSLYKHRERMDITNYRAISLLPTFSKIFDKHMHIK